MQVAVTIRLLGYMDTNTKKKRKKSRNHKTNVTENKCVNRMLKGRGGNPWPQEHVA